jgi:large subunit ribosomal protein L25
MAQSSITKLTVASREPGSSRATRRLRRQGSVPGVIYGRGEDPVPFSANERDLRHALAAAGAVLELSIDGSRSESAVVKETQRHAVRGDLVHVDLLRVDLNQAIHAVVTLELTGADDAPGAREGGVLEHVLREVNVEALPNDIPDTIAFDVSAMQINDSATLGQVTPPDGVTLLDDLETTIATITPPRLQAEAGEEIETEVGVVGEAAGAGEAAGSSGGE